MGPQFNTLLGGCSSAALSACLGGLARWTRRLLGKEGAHGRSFPRSKGGRARTGRTPTGGLGSISSTAFLSRGVTQSWLGGLQDSFRPWCSPRHLLCCPPFDAGGPIQCSHVAPFDAGDPIQCSRPASPAPHHVLSTQHTSIQYYIRPTGNGPRSGGNRCCRTTSRVGH